jgi:hypothetical protein
MYASPVGAADRIYLASREGTTVVLERGKFEKSGDKNRAVVAATNKLDEEFDASPDIVGGELLLRGREHLYLISE